MSIEPNNNYNNSRPSIRTWMHLISGSIYLIMGALVIYLKFFNSIQLSNGAAYAFGCLLLLYGIFRLYRGVVNFRNDKLDQ
jgi:uncharacterized membrane protein HdeD (DUF308 family)